MERSFDKTFQEIRRHIQSNAPRQAHQADDEIKLLERKEANRQPQSAHSRIPAAGLDPQRRITRRLMLETQDSAVSPKSTPMRSQEAGDEPPPERRSLRLSRTTNTTSPPSSPEPSRWTELNPDWAKTWRMPLVYHRTTVEKDDIPRLDEGQCLNDNLIGFYLRYLFSELERERPEVARRLYFHNTFFYDKLKPKRGRAINYDGVKTWTAKVDLFSYDYIVVPVNEHYHWWVAIICNPGRMDSAAPRNFHSDEDEDGIQVEMDVGGGDNGQATAQTRDGGDAMDIDSHRSAQDVLRRRAEPSSRMSIDSVGESDEAVSEAGEDKGADGTAGSDEDGSRQLPSKTSSQKPKKSGKGVSGPGPRKYNPEDPRIITLDSLGTSHSPACTHLKQYLIAELRDKKGRAMDYSQPIGMKATNIPEQNNFCDCGVYLLGYIEEFLKDPDTFVHDLLRREHRRWDFDASETRNDLRNLIFDLHEEYQNGQEKLRRRKAQAKLKKQLSSPGGPANGTEPTPQPAVEGGSRVASTQPQESRDKPLSSSASPSVKSPNPDPTDVEGKSGRLDTSRRSRPPTAEHRSSGPTPFDGGSNAAADVSHGPGGTQRRSTSRPDSRGSSNPSEPLPSIELGDSRKTVVHRAPHSGSKPSPRRYTTQDVVSIERPDDDDDLLKPIPSSPPTASRGARHLPRETTSTSSFYRQSQGRGGGESRQNRSSRDWYEVPRSPTPMATKNETGQRDQDRAHRSSYFSSAAASSGRGSRSLPRKGIRPNKEHPIDLTDE